MRADNAADNCCRCENESERRDSADFCEVANKPGNRVHPDEQRRNGGGLSNLSPPTKKRDWGEKKSASNCGYTFEETKRCIHAFWDRFRWRRCLRRIATSNQ